jgi:hypothetical protein
VCQIRISIHPSASRLLPLRQIANSHNRIPVNRQFRNSHAHNAPQTSLPVISAKRLASATARAHFRAGRPPQSRIFSPIDCTSPENDDYPPNLVYRIIFYVQTNSYIKSYVFCYAKIHIINRTNLIFTAARVGEFSRLVPAAPSFAPGQIFLTVLVLFQ